MRGVYFDVLVVEQCLEGLLLIFIWICERVVQLFRVVLETLFVCLETHYLGLKVPLRGYLRL